MTAKPALFALAVLTAPGLAVADDNVCTMDKVAGTYGFSASGTILPSNEVGLPAGLAVATGVITFDKNGQMYGKETVSFNGSVVSAVPFQGTYVLNPDCTVTLVEREIIRNFGVVVAGGNEMVLMSTNSGVLLNFTAKRISPR